MSPPTCLSAPATAPRQQLCCITCYGAGDGRRAKIGGCGASVLASAASKRGCTHTPSCRHHLDRSCEASALVLAHVAPLDAACCDSCVLRIILVQELLGMVRASAIHELPRSASPLRGTAPAGMPGSTIPMLLRQVPANVAGKHAWRETLGIASHGAVAALRQRIRCLEQQIRMHSLHLEHLGTRRVLACNDPDKLAVARMNMYQKLDEVRCCCSG